ANRDDIAISIYTIDGKVISAGEDQKKFTLQSISKVLSLALVLEESGTELVFSKVGMEPTGDPFNSIAKLEKSESAKPLNPMINAGALAVTSLIKGMNAAEKFENLKSYVSKL